MLVFTPTDTKQKVGERSIYVSIHTDRYKQKVGERVFTLVFTPTDIKQKVGEGSINGVAEVSPKRQNTGKDSTDRLCMTCS